MESIIPPSIQEKLQTTKCKDCDEQGTKDDSLEIISLS